MRKLTFFYLSTNFLLLFMKFKILSVFFITLLFSACQAGWTEENVAEIENQTSTIVSIQFFEEGQIVDSVQIQPTEKLLYAREVFAGTGKLSPPDVTKEYFSGHKYGVWPRRSDSLVVIFNHRYRVTHYYDSILPANTPTKFYGYNHERNIPNQKNFEMVVKKASKQTVSYLFTYTFTEDDYRFAKE